MRQTIETRVLSQDSIKLTFLSVSLLAYGDLVVDRYSGCYI